MSFAALRAVMAVLDTDPADLDSLDRLAYVVLGDAANKDGVVWLGSTVLARRMGYGTKWGPANARRRRGHLLTRGYLFLDETPRSGQTRTYRIPLVGVDGLSTTRAWETRVDPAEPAPGGRAPAPGGRDPAPGGRAIPSNSLEFSQDNPAADSTPAAFTNAAGAAAWARARARFA